MAIDITTTDETLIMRVKDDGIGPGERPRGQGFGLPECASALMRSVESSRCEAYRAAAPR